MNGAELHVVMVSCVYPPEPVVSAQTSLHIAEGLSRRGHRVTVVTSFPRRPAGKLFPGFSRRFVSREKLGSGPQIRRCYSTISIESRMVSRLGENLSFGLTSAWQVLTVRRPDVVYANTWPIVAAGLLFLASRARRIPLVVSVQDIYPEALVAQRRIADGGRLARLMRWVDGHIARGSARVLVISARFAGIYLNQRRVRPERLALIPNWIDANHIDVSVSGDHYRARQGIADSDFLLVSGGNIGVAAGVETVIEAMRLHAGGRQVRLLVAGAGSQLAACRRLAQALPEGRVQFHSPWAAEDTSQVLRAADVLVLPTQRDQSLASVPSKLLSYMLAGRPVLATAVAGSDVAELIGRAECGWVVEPERADLLAAEVARIAALAPDQRRRRGERGRAYALEYLTRDVCLPEVLRAIEEAA